MRTPIRLLQARLARDERAAVINRNTDDLRRQGRRVLGRTHNPRRRFKGLCRLHWAQRYDGEAEQTKAHFMVPILQRLSSMSSGYVISKAHSIVASPMCGTSSSHVRMPRSARSAA